VSAWFGSLGEPIANAESEQVRTYLLGLGIVDEVSVETIADWQDARSVITNPDWDRRWWDAEQLEKQRLYAKAIALRGESDVLHLLSSTLAASDAVKNAAELAAARLGCTEAGLVGSAAGAASEAFHLGELARLAGEPDAHPFRLKQALFSAGRWPLGMSNGRYHLF
jgi:hypothetical protein